MAGTIRVPLLARQAVPTSGLKPAAVRSFGIVVSLVTGFRLVLLFQVLNKLY